MGSARYKGNVLLRVENFLKDDAAAKDRAEQLQHLLTVFKTTESQTRPDHPDPDMESALNSLKVEQKSDGVQLSASIPRALIEKLFETPTEPEPENAQPAPKPHSKRHRNRR